MEEIAVDVRERRKILVEVRWAPLDAHIQDFKEILDC